MTDSRDSGFLLVDMLVAMSLAVLFIVVITGSYTSDEDILYRAKERSQALSIYEASSSMFGSLPPYGSYHSDGVDSYGRWYGNDLNETDVSAAGVSFTGIRSRQSGNYLDFAGTPLCSVDFSSVSEVGSYAFVSERDRHSAPGNLQVSITPITLPINPLLPLTDLEVRDGVAYISADPSNSSDPDIIIADIRDPKNPHILSSIHSGPGLASISLAGNRIYGASMSTVAELNVIRLDSLNDPILEQKYKLPLPYATATAPLASSIFYDKGFVYLGTEKWDGQEFAVIDVSNPAKAVKVGGLETGSKVNAIFVRDGTAYIAASDEKQLRVADVGDPSDPLEINSFSPSGSGRQEGKTINYFEDGLNIGRTSGGYNMTQDHEIFAFATTSSTTLVSLVSVDIPGGVYGIVSDRFRIYAATRSIGSELQIFDRELDASSSVSFSLPVAPQTITCDRDKLYILANTAPVIYEVSI